uniref:Glycosyltransferase n=1 Tax=viral metagenome TaxID=1070528 RepID=A0A6C0AZ53_9ZZZZ
MESLTKNVVAIITRYNEYIDWIEYIIDKVDYIYIYNKGPNNNYFKYFFPNEEMLKKIQFDVLPNVGRIDHTLAYYITKHWDNLPETLINLPGSILMCHRKGAYLSTIMKTIKMNNIKTKYSGFYSPRFRKVSTDYNYNIDNYQAEGICNRNDNQFIKSQYKNFQEWKKALIDERPMHYLAIRGMFIVSKENILHIKKEVYTNLVESLSVGDNIENGHFAERIWAHLFRQYSFDSKMIV